MATSIDRRASGPEGPRIPIKIYILLAVALLGSIIYLSNQKIVVETPSEYLGYGEVIPGEGENESGFVDPGVEIMAKILSLREGFSPPPDFYNLEGIGNDGIEGPVIVSSSSNVLRDPKFQDSLLTRKNVPDGFFDLGNVATGIGYVALPEIAAEVLNNVGEGTYFDRVFSKHPMDGAVREQMREAYASGDLDTYNELVTSYTRELEEDKVLRQIAADATFIDGYYSDLAVRMQVDLLFAAINFPNMTEQERQESIIDLGIQAATLKGIHEFMEPYNGGFSPEQIDVAAKAVERSAFLLKLHLLSEASYTDPIAIERSYARVRFLDSYDPEEGYNPEALRIPSRQGLNWMPGDNALVLVGEYCCRFSHPEMFKNSRYYLQITQ